MKQEQVWVVIHGHFYQPPREDPWSGEIDFQESALPWRDWNTRINDESYAANTDARTLDQAGRITGIYNNYSKISYNFGPTLLSWLERHDPATYEAVLQADLDSRAENGGHGNAIAQAYNHIILPLANEEDRLTQIKWGLADFKSRFGREAEGLWLAETAINYPTAEALVEAGVKFVILSPTQAEAIRFPGGDWQDVSASSIDTSAAWRIETRHGSLAAFFYDLDISRAVGFEHLLTSAEGFAERLLAGAEGERIGPLVNIATDGESYGHHEPFANMCLAALIRENEARPRFKLTNYGFYLENFPPVGEVRLKSGNAGLGTAWSCSHGVGRWMEDCGCGGGGGWHQAWRGPLRAAFDYLRDRLWELALKESGELVHDFAGLRNAYIDFIRLTESGQAKRDLKDEFESFIKPFLARELKDSELLKLRLILESQRYGLYMYTSCGWFFSEISGLEAVQCLRYAARAIELASPWLAPETEEDLLKILETAPSNLAHYGNGRRIWEKLVKQTAFDRQHLVNHLVLSRVFDQGELEGEVFFYRYKITELKELKKRKPTRLIRGRLSLEDGLTWERSEWFWFLRIDPPAGVSLWARASEEARLGDWIAEVFDSASPADLERRMGEWIPRPLGLGDLKHEKKLSILKAIFARTIEDLIRQPRPESLPEVLEMFEAFGRYGLHLPENVRPAVELVSNGVIRRELAHLGQGKQKCDFSKIALILDLAHRTRLGLDHQAVAELHEQHLILRYEAFARAPLANQPWRDLMELLEFANRAGLEYDRRWIENRAWADLNQVLPPLLDSARTKDRPLVERYLKVAEQVNIQVKDWWREYRIKFLSGEDDPPVG